MSATSVAKRESEASNIASKIAVGAAALSTGTYVSPRSQERCKIEMGCNQCMTAVGSDKRAESGGQKELGDHNLKAALP